LAFSLQLEGIRELRESDGEVFIELRAFPAAAEAERQLEQGRVARVVAANLLPARAEALAAAAAANRMTAQVRMSASSRIVTLPPLPRRRRNPLYCSGDGAFSPTVINI
jgi:hypothetical protein